MYNHYIVDLLNCLLYVKNVDKKEQQTMKTTMLSAVLASALVMATSSVAADTYAVISTGEYSVEDGTQASEISAGLGMTFIEKGNLSFSVEGTFSQSSNNTVDFEATVGSLYDVTEFGEATLGLGIFAGVGWEDVSNFNIDNNAWVYGVQAVIGNDNIGLRTRVYLTDFEDVTASASVTFNF